MANTDLGEDIREDPETIEYYVGEVKKNIAKKVEKENENRFLHSSLRSSERLRAIEQYQRVIYSGYPDTYAVNEAFEEDETMPPPIEELEELIKYLETKLAKRPISSQQLSQCVSVEAGQPVTDADQWQLLLNRLSDPDTAKALLMHGRVLNAYRRCRAEMENRPRVEWPVLPGLALDALTLVKNHLMANYLQHPMGTESSTLSHAYSLYQILTSPLLKNYMAAMDGLANTWLTSVHNTDMSSLVNAESIGWEQSSLLVPVQSMEEEEEDDTILMSGVPGCYSIIAYDDNGRYSVSSQGVRLRYVVLNKGNNDFIGATVHIEDRSVYVSRIINGGVAQKTHLLHEGDEILAANGIELLGKDLNTVCNIMAEMRGTIVLLVAPTCEPLVSDTSNTGIIHLRAMFTYDPKEDSYLSCKQLGLSFIKGDILHVTGRSDPNWWQAYRRDSEKSIMGATGTLAGLIPSPFFQFHRTSMQLHHKLKTDSEEVDFFELPEDTALETVPQSTKQSGGKQSFFKRIFGEKEKGALEKMALSSLDVANISGTDCRQVAVSSDLLAPVYATRPSINSTVKYSLSSSSPSLSLPKMFADAGVIWGQHGNELNGHRVKRSRSTSKKPNKNYLSILQSLSANLDLHENEADPVAWLDDAVSNGYMPHPSLWTYEPVAQYLPQPLRRRPLVLVGSIYVGRHQLMLLLINTDTKRFSAAPIHTTNASMSENTATPYKCVSEEVFEAMRKANKFIEWGVFNKARYGTAFDTVASKIQDGKVCCITLKPESLRAVRATGWKPCVIFISPPERTDELRLIHEQLGLNYVATDLELKECIETSRQMEVRYGHFFDFVIIPYSKVSALDQLLAIATSLERERSWVPRYWLRGTVKPA